MCARSQHSGDISSDTCPRCAASGTGASRPRVRRRDSSSAAAISGLATTSDARGLEPSPVVEQLVGGAPAAGDEAVEVLGGRGARRVVGPEPFERGLGRVEARDRGARASAGSCSAVAGRGVHRSRTRCRRPQSARAAATGSSSSAVVTATATGHHSSGSASIMRSSSQPRGRTGGNSVVVWYARSSTVGQPASWPSADPLPRTSSGASGTTLACSSTRIIITGAVEQVAGPVVGARSRPGRGGPIRCGRDRCRATPPTRVERNPVGRARRVERRVGEARGEHRPEVVGAVPRGVVRRVVAGAPASRFTWIDAVLRIIVRPAGQRGVEVLLHRAVAGRVEHTRDIAPGVDRGAHEVEVDGDRARTAPPRCRRASLARGAESAGADRAAQLELAAGLERDPAPAGELAGERARRARPATAPRPSARDDDPLELDADPPAVRGSPREVEDLLVDESADVGDA